MTHIVVINVFIWDQLVPLSTVLVNINTSGWMDSNDKRIAFFGIFGFLQKTLAAHISASRRGTEAVQYSKSLSGVPLCSQTSSWPWGSIMRPLEPQKWARSRIFKISNFSPFRPKNPFFYCKRQPMDIEQQCRLISIKNKPLGGQNLWKNGRFTVIFQF